MPAKKNLISEPTTEELFFAYSNQIELFINTRKVKLINKGNPFTFSQFKTNIKQYLFKDYMINLVNVLYAPLYMVLNDVAFWFSEAGWTLPAKLLGRIPASWPTSFQREVENYMIKEIFGFSAGGENKDLNILLLQNLTLQQHKAQDPEKFFAITNSLEKMIKNRFKYYSAKKAERTDLTISFFSILVSLIALGKSDWSFYELANNLAVFWAKEEAASNFIFGHNLGLAFYSVFTQEPTTAKKVISFLIIFIAMSIAIQVFCLLSHILQIRANQILNRAHFFIDNIKPRLQTHILEILEK